MLFASTHQVSVIDMISLGNSAITAVTGEKKTHAFHDSQE